MVYVKVCDECGERMERPYFWRIERIRSEDELTTTVHATHLHDSCAVVRLTREVYGPDDVDES